MIIVVLELHDRILAIAFKKYRGLVELLLGDDRIMDVGHLNNLGKIIGHVLVTLAFPVLGFNLGIIAMLVPD